MKSNILMETPRSFFSLIRFPYQGNCIVWLPVSQCFHFRFAFTLNQQARIRLIGLRISDPFYTNYFPFQYFF